MSRLNPAIVWLLRSPLHPLLSRRLQISGKLILALKLHLILG